MPPTAARSAATCAPLRLRVPALKRSCVSQDSSASPGEAPRSWHAQDNPSLLLRGKRATAPQHLLPQRPWQHGHGSSHARTRSRSQPPRLYRGQTKRSRRERRQGEREERLQQVGAWCAAGSPPDGRHPCCQRRLSAGSLRYPVLRHAPHHNCRRRSGGRLVAVAVAGVACCHHELSATVSVRQRGRKTT